MTAEVEHQGSPNRLTIYIAENGALTYELSSRKSGISAGILELNKPFPTGWADWKLTADQLLPHAEQHFTAQPAAASGAPGAGMEGVLIRASHGGASFEQWVAPGVPASFSTESKK